MLAPGESFQYSSWCPLKTPLGKMRAPIGWPAPGGAQFDIKIAPFALKAAYTVN